MDHVTVSDIFQYFGGGSLLALAIATFKFVRDSRDTLRDLARDAAERRQRVERIEADLQQLRDWAVREGFGE